jgi:hypothetical protein
VKIRHQLTLSGAFKKMAEKGIRFTSYEVRGGDGKPIVEEDDDR